jgi:hypothetical protein
MSSFASEKLLTAALGGLLAALPACSGRTAPNPPVDAGISVDAPADTSSDGTADFDAYADADAASTADVSDASFACEAGIDADAATVTSTTVDPTMTLTTFTDECNQRGGVLEVEPECGGHNSCRGISWDTGTETITEHTCKGMNTCAGYSCIICD